MANFQKDGLWVQGGQGKLANVNETTPYVPGQLGKVLAIRDTTYNSPRFYQYVQRYTTDTYTPAAGSIFYWNDYTKFIVTLDSTAAIGSSTNPVVAGVALGTYPGTGNYGFIQVGGIASAAVTDTIAAGDGLVAALNTFQQLADIGTVTTQQALAAQIPIVAIALSAVGTSTNSAIDVGLRTFQVGW